MSLDSLFRTSLSPRNEQLLPIGAILPEVLKRYDLWPAEADLEISRPAAGTSVWLESATTSSLATVDGIPY